MSGDRLQARSPLVVQREAYIQLGLGVLALVAAATGTWWLLQGRLHPSVWLGVAGALTLAATFLSEGRRARDEYAWVQPHDAHTTAMRLAVPGTTERGTPATHRRGLLGFMVFGIVASVSGPGLNVLLRIVTRGAADNLDLLAWALFTLPICLAVLMLPPRGLAPKRSRGERPPGCCGPRSRVWHPRATIPASGLCRVK
jgi:hypothetical protein